MYKDGEETDGPFSVCARGDVQLAESPETGCADPKSSDGPPSEAIAHAVRLLRSRKVARKVGEENKNQTDNANQTPEETPDLITPMESTEPSITPSPISIRRSGGIRKPTVKLNFQRGKECSAYSYSFI
ncbi:hypothetical protein Trydic_g9713 [Trypoxylus dichotomus]